jgi:hypothetical protein
MDVVELRALFLGALVAMGTITVVLGQAVRALVDRWRSRRARGATRARTPRTVGTA